MHANAANVLIAGFVGTKSQWRKLQRGWQSVLDRDGVEWFHCTDAMGFRRSYSGWTRAKRDAHLERLTRAVAASGLHPVAVCFSGNWTTTVAHDADWIERFPSAYAWCFEATVKALERVADERFTAQQIALAFCEHEQYQARAREVYDHFRFNGLWSQFVSLSFVNPRQSSEAQCADLITWEVQRDINQAGLPFEKQSKLALLDIMCARSFTWLRYDEAALTNQMSDVRGPPMKRPPGYQS